jgi:hypothetical protein
MAARLPLAFNPKAHSASAVSATLLDDPASRSNEQLLGPVLSRLVDMALAAALAVVLFTLTALLSA